MVTQNQVLLERLKAQIVGENNQILKREIDSILSEISKLRVDDFSSLSRAQLKTFTDRVDATVTKATLAKTNHVAGYMQEVAADEAIFAAEAIGSTVDVATPKVVANQAYKAAVTDVMSATGTTLPEFMEGWSINQRDRIMQTVQKGLKEGWTTSRMMSEFKGTSAGNFTDGLHGKEARNARTVINTATQHVANTAYQDTWKEAGDDVVVGYKWVSTLDQSTSGVCRNLDGEVFEFEKGPVPPIHPNCRSTTIPKMSPELEFLEEGRTRASADGPTSADQNYYEWLETQPAAFQDEALGKGKGVVFREKGADWYKKNNTTKAGKELNTTELTSTVEKRKASEKKRAATLAKNKKAKEVDAAKKARDIAAAKKAGEETARKTAEKKKDIAARRDAAAAVRKANDKKERDAAKEKKRVAALAKKQKDAADAEAKVKALEKRIKDTEKKLADLAAADKKVGRKVKISEAQIVRNEIDQLYAATPLTPKDILKMNALGEEYEGHEKILRKQGWLPAPDRKRMKESWREREVFVAKRDGARVTDDELLRDIIFKKRHNVKLPVPKIITDGRKSDLVQTERKLANSMEIFQNSLSEKNAQIIKDGNYHKNAEVLMGNSRAHYDNSIKRIVIGPRVPESTILHEYAHALEYASPSVARKSSKFLWKRTRGEKVEKLSIITGNPSYRDNEVAFRDEFISRGGSAYMGKDYMGIPATELVTMGIERLLASPATFRRDDPEYFNFMIGILND